MKEKLSEKPAVEVQNSQTILVIQQLEQLLGIRLAELPDSTFKITRFIPLGKSGFLNIYTRRCLPKAGSLFDRIEVVLVDVGIKRVVFSGPVWVGQPAPLEHLIDELVIVLGKDLFKKGRLTIRDCAALKRGCWAGRRWQLVFASGQRLPLLIDLMDSQLQLCIYMPV